MSTGLVGALLCLAAISTAAQGQYALDRWNTDAGLPQNSVNAIIQSRTGHLWLATLGGIGRFDGTTFTTITTGDRTGLPSDRVQGITEDALGRVWIATDAGIARLDRGRIQPVALGTASADLDIRAIAAHPDGSIWFGSAIGGLGRIDSTGARAIVNARGTLGEVIFSIVVARDRSVWVSADKGIFRVADGGMTPALVRPNSVAKDGFHEKAFADPVDGAWVLTRNSLVHIGRTRSTEHVFPQSADGTISNVLAIAADGANVVWLGTRMDEIWRFRVDSAVATRVKQPEPGSLTTLLLDREGSLWAGSRINGLARVRRTLFQTFTVADGLVYDNTISVFADSRSRMWAAAKCEGGSVREGPRFRVLGKSEAPECIWTFAEDTAGAIWIGGEGLGRWRGGVYRPMTGLPPEFLHSVRAVMRARDGTMWVGSNRGIASWDGRAFRVHDNSAGTGRVNIHTIYEARDGALWIGAFEGLFRFRDGTFEPVSRVKGGVRAVYEDADGVFWIATYGNGLARVRGTRVTTYTTADGLLDNFLSSVTEDEKGNLWLSSNRGVFRVPRAELNTYAPGADARLHSVFYGRSDGMISSETNGGAQTSVARTPDGRLWYPTLIGVVAIDLARAGDVVPPAVSIDRVLVNGKSQPLAEGLTIGPGASDVEIAYSGVSLNAPNAVSYRYRLDPWDRKWIDAAGRRSASYSRLSPGTYHFRVAAANRDGVWSEESSPLAFRVKPQIWQTWWFRVLATLAIAAVPAIRLRQLRHRQIVLTRLVEEKTHELREQKEEIEAQAHELEQQNEILAENVRLKDDVERISRHDLRTPLTSIISLSQIVRERPGLSAEHDAALQLIEQAGYRVLNMANLTLDLYKMEQGTYHLRPKSIDIRAVITRVLLDLDALIRTSAVSCVVDVDADVAERPLVQGDELLSHSMLVNLVKNAVEASPRGGVVTIRVSLDERLHVRIHNAGEIPALLRDRFFEKYSTSGKVGGTGLGAYSARLMAQTQGGSVSVESSTAAEGTTVLLTLLPASVIERRSRERASDDAVWEDDLRQFGPREQWPSRHILVVDDDVSNRTIMRHYLAHPAWTVDEAENGPLALRLFAEHSYDHVIMDLEMPVMNGFEVAERMRGLETTGGTRRTTIMAFSSHDEADMIERALRSGFDHYMTKPVSRTSVTARVLGGIARGTREITLGHEAADDTRVMPGSVTLDPELRNLIPAFLAEKALDIAQLAEASARDDLTTIRRLTHRLRGSLSLYGFHDASLRCAEIESLATSGQSELARRQVTGLSEYMRAVAISYTDPFPHEVPPS